MKSNINVLGAGMMKFDKSRQICYTFHGYSSFLQSYSFILLNEAGYLLLCNFLFVQRLPVGQNCR
ncbi:hypothetical protein Peur_049966 [Populus x canadensis]